MFSVIAGDTNAFVYHTSFGNKLPVTSKLMTSRRKNRCASIQHVINTPSNPTFIELNWGLHGYTFLSILL